MTNADYTSWMATSLKSITSCPTGWGETMRSSIYNYCIDIVMIEKRPARLGQEVRMTNAALLRSRMKGNRAPRDAVLNP